MASSVDKLRMTFGRKNAMKESIINESHISSYPSPSTHMHKDLEIYVINLDRSQDRMLMMTERLEKLSLPYKRVSAVDGSHVKFGRHEINAGKYLFAHGKIPQPGEIGCFMSHYSVMSEFIKHSEKEYALIFEDDMVFDSDFKDVISALLERRDWDMVKLNSVHGGGNVGLKPLCTGRFLALNLFHQSKAGAYIVNRSAAKNYIAEMLPMFVPFDHEFMKFWKYNIRSFSVLPSPSWESWEGARTIDYDAVRRGRKPWYRPSVALYRSYIGIRRIMYVLSALFRK